MADNDNTDNKNLENEEKVKNAEAVLAKNKELQEELRKEREKRSILEKEKTDREDAALKEQGKYKELAESKDKELADLKASLATETKTRIDAQKVGAVKVEMEKLGLSPDRANVALGLFRVDDVKYDEATKAVLNASDIAKSVMDKVPEIFGQDGNRVPNGSGGNGGGTPPADMSDEWWDKLSSEEQKKHYKAYMAKKGVTIK